MGQRDFSLIEYMLCEARWIFWQGQDSMFDRRGAVPGGRFLRPQAAARQKEFDSGAGVC